MSISDDRNIVSVFQERRDAERAVEELHRAGFGDGQIGVAFHDQGHQAEAGGTLTPGDTKVTEGAAGGAATGGVIGGVIGAAATGVIPGIGPIIAAGTLASILAGAGAGAATGGLFGSVVGLGVSDEDARFYEQEFNRGGSLVAVRADDHFDEAINILNRNGGRFANDRIANRTPSGRQEDEPVSDPNRTADRTSSRQSMAEPRNVSGVEGENEAMVRGETTIPREGRAITDPGRTYTPTGGTGGEVVRGHGIDDRGPIQDRSWEEVRDSYRSDFERRSAGSGMRWEDTEPGYHYSHEMANDPRYRGRRWEEVEPELRQNYGEWYAQRGYTRTTGDRVLTSWLGFERRVGETWNRLFGSGDDRDRDHRAHDTSDEGRSHNP